MNYRILVVDDSAIVTNVVSAALSRAGHKVEVVNSALQVTAKIVEFKPELILMDLKMPGMEGEKIIDLAHRRGFKFNFSIIVHSSEDESRLIEAANKPGVIGYIKKGKPDEAFLRSVERFCMEHRTRCILDQDKRRIPDNGNLLDIAS